jgi:twitching motility two-component system response regulator PilG
MGSYGIPQKLHPPSLLAQLSSRQASGCLHIASGTVNWSIHLEQGKLTFASSSIDPFGRLDRHLRRLSIRIPSLVSAIRVQVRLLFETPADSQPSQGRDYQAICWLVEQHHLNGSQAALLIEELSREVIESFLAVQAGHYELLEHNQLSEFPTFCRLDILPLVEFCQNQQRRRQALGGPSNPIATDRTEILNANVPLASPNVSRPPVTPAPNPPAAANPNPTPPIHNAPPARTEPPAQPPVRATHTIACIDDSPSVLNAINSFLDDKGISVIMINDPVKALMQVIRSKPDLILLDITMPNLDGYELCSLLRKHPQFKRTPVVMVTSNSGFIDRAKAKLVGASGYLTKPFTQPDLIKMVFKHLS